MNFSDSHNKYKISNTYKKKTLEVKSWILPNSKQAVWEYKEKTLKRI